MSWWEDRVVPHITERSLGMEEVRRRRVRVCAGLRGRVLEIGFGSGHNVALYPDEVTEVRAVEPNDVGWRMARRRVEQARTTIHRTGLDGQRLNEPAATFDCVLSTFTLCTIPDQRAALAEARRVLRPGGALHFLEHGLSPEPRVEIWQHRLEPLQRRFAGGCHLTRDHVADMTAAGFELTDLANEYLPGPAFTKPLGYLYLGTARAA